MPADGYSLAAGDTLAPFWKEACVASTHGVLSLLACGKKCHTLKDMHPALQGQRRAEGQSQVARWADGQLLRPTDHGAEGKERKSYLMGKVEPFWEMDWSQGGVGRPWVWVWAWAHCTHRGLSQCH